MKVKLLKATVYQRKKSSRPSPFSWDTKPLGPPPGCHTLCHSRDKPQEPARAELRPLCPPALYPRPRAGPTEAAGLTLASKTTSLRAGPLRRVRKCFQSRHRLRDTSNVLPAGRRDLCGQDLNSLVGLGGPALWFTARPAGSCSSYLGPLPRRGLWREPG